MKSKIIITAIALILLSLGSAFSADKNFGGEISAKGAIVDINGSKAKFNEYRDLESGLYGRIKLGYDNDKYFLKFKASDIAYDTQNYKLDGGMWGKFKYNLSYNEIPHNFTFDARTFYAGAGTNNLTGTPNTNVGTWNKFDYSIERKQYGGGVKLEMLKPFYFDVSVAREERDGIKPTAGSITTPGGPFIELPEPVSYTTDSLKVEAGYAKKPFFASVSYLYSDFSNDHKLLNWQHPTRTTLTERTTLPPDNEYHKIAFKGSVKLPMNSKFNVNLSSSAAKSDFSLLNSFIYEGAAAVTALTLSDGTFDGKVNTQNYAFVLTSNPVSFLDGKIFYKYYNKDNKSDRITTTDPNNSAPFQNHLFDYKKDYFGVELGFRLPAHFYLKTAYNYLKIDRNRGDFPETTDDIYSVDLKWSGLDFMTAKVGYERLNRSGDHKIITALFADEQATYNALEPFVWRYDAAPQDRDTYKAAIEIYPVANLSVGLGYKYKKSNYKDTVLGLRDDKREEFLIDGDYEIGKLAKVFAYYNYERIKSYQFQRRYNASFTSIPANQINPATTTAATTSFFNWDVKQKDETDEFGVGTDIYVLPKLLTLKLQYDDVRSNGTADFTEYVAFGSGHTNDNIDISNWDDYRKKSFKAKAVYDFSKAISVMAGYAYEQYKYSDAALDNYQYTIVQGANTSYLTGAYKDQSYNASVIFAGVTYRF